MTQGNNGTSLESEELAYPNGAMRRKCRAINVVTGKLVTVYCGIPDTYFSIPCRGGGWIGSEDGTFQYHPPKK